MSDADRPDLTEAYPPEDACETSDRIDRACRIHPTCHLTRAALRAVRGERDAMRARVKAVAANHMREIDRAKKAEAELGLRAQEIADRDGTIARAEADLKRVTEERDRAEALLTEAFVVTVKPVADGHVTHGERYWMLRDRIAQLLKDRRRQHV